MKKIRLRAINLPEGFSSTGWIEYEVEEIPDEKMVSKEEVLKVFDESFVAWNKLHRYPTTFKNHFRKALENL